MKVLIVEDEKNLNKIIAKRLKIEGYSTDSAFNGLEALECLSITEYDAILLDVDNGPDGLTRAENDGLYSERGLAAARAALVRGGPGQCPA